MHLSRLILNPRSRQVQRELADVYEMHRTICRAFPEDAFHDNTPSGVLFRLEVSSQSGAIVLLVQSALMPDWSFLRVPGKDYLLSPHRLSSVVDNPAVKVVNLQIRTGQRLAFRLRSNPTRRLKENKRRVGLLQEEQQLAWLTRKLDAAGADLLSARISGKSELRGGLFSRPASGQYMSFLAVQFDGVLLVRDADRLKSAVEAGIGSAKSFGFGLLSLAPLRG